MGTVLSLPPAPGTGCVRGRGRRRRRRRRVRPRPRGRRGGRPGLTHGCTRLGAGASSSTRPLPTTGAPYPPISIGRALATPFPTIGGRRGTRAVTCRHTIRPRPQRGTRRVRRAATLALVSVTTRASTITRSPPRRGAQSIRAGVAVLALGHTTTGLGTITRAPGTTGATTPWVCSRGGLATPTRRALPIPV